jgi:hypothetical protein
VPFVDVPHGRVEIQRAQRTHAADAEHGLLLLAQLVAAAVELARDRAVLGRVLGHVRIEQQHRDAADRRLPDAHGHAALEPRARDAHLAAVGVQRHGERRAARIDRRIVRDLLAAPVDALMKIAVAVEQPHGHERQVQVARRLAMVAREHAEASRVDREALVPAVLGAEIRDEVALLEPVARHGLCPEVLVERRDDAAVLLEETLVGRRVIEDALIHGAQEQPRTRLDLAPELRIELAEELAQGRVPAEPEVLREIVEPLERRRNLRRNLQSVHAARHHKSFCRVDLGRTRLF